MLDRRFILLVLLTPAFLGLMNCASSSRIDTSVSTTPTTTIRTEALSKEIDKLVTSAMSALEVVPGFALAVYTPDGVYTRGFGVTDVETSEEVSADTVFYIASITKSFTALAMNILHHRGEFNLDSTLQDFAPDANFPVTLSPDKVILRNFLTHTSGISNTPLSFRSALSGEHNAALDWKLLSTSMPKKDAPLGKHQYRNDGYNILTTLTNKKLGLSWEELIAREILIPLKMEHTSTSMSEAVEKQWSIARPHFSGISEGPLRTSFEKVDATMHSAGGMLMSANDALRWLELIIEDGAIDGRQIIPAAVIHETRRKFIKVGGEHSLHERGYYGLGWYIGSYRGNTLVHHLGDFSDFHTQVSYIPSRKIGVIAFVNSQQIGKPFTEIIVSFVYDRLSGNRFALKNARERIRRLVHKRKQIFKQEANDRKERITQQWVLTQPFNAYAGTYENTLYGGLDIKVEGGSMIFSTGELLHSIAEPHPLVDHARIELTPYRGIPVEFLINDSGEVTGFVFTTNTEVVQFNKTNGTT